MPTYEITDDRTGRTIEMEGDAMPTQQDIEAAFAATTTQKLAQVATAPIRGLRGLGVLAQALVAPGEDRFGEEPRPKTVGEAFHRAAEAVKPGYQPRAGERLGAAAGEMAATALPMAATGGGGLAAQMLKGALSNAALTTLTEASERGNVEPVDVGVSAALGGTIPIFGPSLKVVARAMRSGSKVAATSGTTLEREAVDELLKNPKLLDEYQGTAAAVGEKVKSIGQALIQQHEEASQVLDKARKAIGFRERFSDSMRRVQKEGFQPANVQEIIEDFQVLAKDKVPVQLFRKERVARVPVFTSDAARAQAAAAEQELLALVPQKKALGQALNEQQSAFTALQRQPPTRGGQKELAQRVAGVGQAKRAYDAVAKRIKEIEDLQSAARGDAAMEYTEHALPAINEQQMVELPTKARLRDLVRLREKVDDLIYYPAASADVPKIGSADQAFLKTLRKKINTIIEKIPGGQDLRDADAVYSSSRELYDDFQKSLATDGKAEDIVRRIVMGGDLDDVIGKRGEHIKLIKAIEAKKKVQLLEPAKKEFAARSFRNMEATGYGGIPAAAAGPRGVASFLLGAHQAARVPDALAVPFMPMRPGAGSPFSALLQAAAAYGFSDRRPRR